MPSSSPIGAVVRAVRARLAVLHPRIEATPLAQGLLAGTATREAYGCLLDALAGVHAVVDPALAGDHTLCELFGHPALRGDALVADRLVLGRRTPLPAVPLGLPPLLKDHPGRVGTAFVIEGSRLGSRLLLTPLAGLLGCPLTAGQGLDYHLQDAEVAPRRWAATLDRLNSAPLDAETVAVAAENAMAALLSLYAAIPPR